MTLSSWMSAWVTDPLSRAVRNAEYVTSVALWDPLWLKNRNAKEMMRARKMKRVKRLRVFIFSFESPPLPSEPQYLYWS